MTTTMQSFPRSRPLLKPGEAPFAGNSKFEQIYGSTMPIPRAERIPIALSKSSLSPTSDDGRPSTARSLPYSFTSQSSHSSSVTSLPSTFTSISTHPYGAPSPLSTTSLRTPTRKPPKLPQWIFQNLPSNVYDRIVYQLRIIHEESPLRSCQTCYMRDLCSLSLVSRAWDKIAVRRLYERIHLVGHDSKESMKKHKTKLGVRIRLLRRTLRGRRFLAELVRDLKIPCLYTDGDVIPRETIDLVASLVMACPNLEKLHGFHPIYSHEYDRLTHALSTRRRLREHIWLIGENEAISERSQRQLPPGLMDYAQKAAFVQYHNAWTSLTTLLLYAPDHEGILERDIFINQTPHHNDPRRIRGPGILHRLPSLRHLCIANFDMDDFDDSTLQQLPALHSLRLQDLEGVTFWGLSEYSRTRAAFDLRNLALVNLDVTYISAISNLLLHLKNLKRFTLAQDTSPEVVVGEPLIQPIIASHSLTYLHWDVTVPGTAHGNLVGSIRAGGFPRLRTIRTPTDPSGAVQALCRPQACIELPTDWSGQRLRSTGIPLGGLRAARRAAQQRIEDAWSTVAFKVVVTDTDPDPDISISGGSGRTGTGNVTEIYDLNGFMGTIGSPIHYSLSPDVEGSDWALMDFPDFVGNDTATVTPPASSAAAAASAGADGSSTGFVCQGEWNKSHPGGERWWGHRARPRYRGVDLMKFF